MRIERLTPEIALQYKKDIAQFYFENMQACAFLKHFTLIEAIQKMDDFINHLKNGTCVGYGLFQEDAICGYIWAYPHQFREERRMYVNEVRIKENFRNRGYGKVLLKLVEENAKELGINVLYIHAEANNSDAIRLYKTNGYVAERVQLRKELLK